MRYSPGRMLDLISRCWSDGYVFFPTISGSAKNAGERRASYEEGPAFEWPKDRARIEDHLRAHADDDVYWCPSSFERDRRLEGYASPEKALWADLDEVDPEDIELKPTMAWESSPGRWQAVWLLQSELIGASWAGKENQRLTYYLGADLSGWDTTQLLRLPTWPNHKPDRREANDGKPPMGRVLWTHGPKYQPADFDDLPEIEHVAAAAEALDFEIDRVDRHEVWARVRMKLPPTIRQMVAARNDGGADRSEVLWQIERELADAGCSVSEIVAIVRSTVWNKYDGRNDEMRRLTTEAFKAVSAIRSDPLEEDDRLEVRDRPQLPADAFKDVRRPRWLVEKIWQKGSCGFIAGPPKAYKSYTGLDMAFSIASGEPFLGQFRVEEPGNVLYIQEEDPLPVVKLRYEEMVAGKNRFLHHEGYMAHDERTGLIAWHPPRAVVPMWLYVGKGFKASDPAWQSWLDEMIEELNIQAVFLDTLGTTAGDVDVDRYSEVMDRILAPLKDLSHRRDCLLAIVHHNSKNKDTLNGQAMLGSTAFHGWVEDAMYFGYMDGGFRMMRESKLDTPLYLDVSVPRIDRSLGWRPQAEIIDHTMHDERPAEGAAKERQIDLGSKKRTRAPRVVSVIRAAGGILSTEEIVLLAAMPRGTALRQLRQAQGAGLLSSPSPGKWALVD